MTKKLYYCLLCIQILAIEFCVGYRRIINGDPIKIEKVPYQAAVYYENKLTCGAVILSEYWLITVSVKFNEILKINNFG